MTQPTDAELRAALRDILFKASGGISDMANVEINKIIQLIATERQQLKERVLEQKRDVTTLEVGGELGNGQDYVDIEAVPVQAIERVFEGSE